MSLNILCDAIAFCYGPAAALSTLIDELLKPCGTSFNFDVMATGSTRELLTRDGHYLNLIDIDSSDPKALGELNVSKYDAFIDVCNPVSYECLRSRGLPTAYVDFLLWMHEGPVAAHFDANLYLAEGYPGTEEWVQLRATEIPNLRVIPPLVHPAHYRPTAGTLLVGLGGLVSDLTPLNAAADYASFVLTALVEALKGSRFKNVTVACGEPVVKSIGPRFSNPKLSFVSLSHQDFLKELSSCEAFVSHPGLYAVFEAMIGGVPTALLPASNYTQVLQLRHYRRLGIAAWSFSWEDIGLSPIPHGLPEPEGVRRTIAQVKEAQQNSKADCDLRSMLGAFFSLDTPALFELGQHQRTICSAFGLEGPAIAAQAIEKWLTNSGLRR